MLATHLEAYRTAQKSTMSGRELEASLLVKAAQMLKQCKDNWNDTDRDARLTDALKFNQKIWSIFQSDLVNPEHPMPLKLREDLLSLSIFIDKRILEIMAFPAPEKLDILINININIAAGLRGSPGESTV